ATVASPTKLALLPSEHIKFTVLFRQSTTALVLVSQLMPKIMSYLVISKTMRSAVVACSWILKEQFFITSLVVTTLPVGLLILKLAGMVSTGKPTFVARPLVMRECVAPVSNKVYAS